MTALVGASTSQAPNLYVELARTVRDQGLQRRCYAHYWTRIVLTVGSFALVWVAVVWLGNSWFQLIPAAVLGLVVTQVGFLSHEAAHRQIFESAAWNDWTARLMGALLAGLSVGWWNRKHNRHHVAPNKEDRDPDIGPGLFAFTAEIAASRTTGPAGWFVRRQGWLFFPILMLEGLNLHIASLQRTLSREPMDYRRTEAALMVFRHVAYVAALLVLLPPGKAAAFFGVQMAVFGFCLGSAFAPNHTGMPIAPRDAKIDFVDRQVLMSRNVSGGYLVGFVMGGLNRQIEHHLFPGMPRPHARRAQPIVRDFCAERGVTYAEEGLFQSYRVIIDYLNHVGLRARRPFECPLAAQLRV